MKMLNKSLLCLLPSVVLFAVAHEHTLCNSSDPAILALQNLEVLVSPMADLWHSVKPFSVDLAAYHDCPVAPFIIEMIALLAQLYNKGDHIPAIRQLAVAYPRSVAFMVAYPPSVVWQDQAWRKVVVELWAAVSARLRPHLGTRQDVVFECAVVHRHRATATAVADHHTGELRFPVPKQLGSSLIPLGYTFRDLTISSRHCPPETATAIVSAARGWLQLGGPGVGVAKFLEVAEGWLARENPFRLLSMSSPYFEFVHAALVADHPQASPLARMLQPRPGTAKRGHGAGQKVMGFECGGVAESRRIQIEFLEAMVRNVPPTWSQTGRGCEVASVISKLASLPPQEVPQVDRTHLSSWYFLQSVNSQWWRPLKSGWGLLLSHTFAQLHGESLRLGFKPRRLPKHCKGSPAINRLQQLSAASLAGDLLEDYNSLPEAMSLVASIHPDCSVAIATALQLALNCYVHRLLEYGRPLKAANATHPLAAEVLTEDASGVVEVIWQTIAGEKLADILSNELPLFELMRLQWKMLFKAATSWPPSPASGHDWLSVTEDNPLAPASWDALHGRIQRQRGVVRGLPVQALGGDEIDRITKSAKFAVQGVVSDLFPRRSAEDKSLTCRCGLHECCLCWAPKAGNLVKGLNSLRLPMEVREELDALVAEELLKFDGESFAGVVSLTKRGQQLCRTFQLLYDIFNTADEEASADAARLRRLLHTLAQHEHGRGAVLRDRLLTFVDAYCREPRRRWQDAVRERPSDPLYEYVCRASEPIGRLLSRVERALDHPSSVSQVSQQRPSAASSIAISSSQLPNIAYTSEYTSHYERHCEEEKAAIAQLLLKKEKQEKFQRDLQAQVAEKREAVRRAVAEEQMADQGELLRRTQTRSEVISEEKKRLLDIALQSERAGRAIEEMHQWRLQRMCNPKSLYKALYHDDMEVQIEQLNRRAHRQFVQVGFGAPVDPLVARAKIVQREFFFPPELRKNLKGKQDAEDTTVERDRSKAFIRVWGPGGNRKPLPDHSDGEVAAVVLGTIYASLETPEAANDGEDIAKVHKAGDGVKAAMDYSWLTAEPDENRSPAVYADLPSKPLDKQKVMRRSKKVVKELIAGMYPVELNTGCCSSPQKEKPSEESHDRRSYFVDHWPDRGSDAPPEESTSGAKLSDAASIGTMSRHTTRGQQRLTKQEEERRKILKRFDEVNSR
ncbi:hypothetical protein FOL47_003533 [Perkinsus chesapeaki]|uniref:Uncharacterized protein n=1 Tax=Perkinsus chesapeaki TaxID=330153 RepID=A0A7J6MZM8_PERCH|nr:hypothetical protein FOL47_003533 [Perkinsus chesapeaki]